MDCPCKRLKCKRHGDCEACRTYHKNRQLKPSCERETASKYLPLWKTLEAREEAELVLSFEEIREILGFPLDHSFLKYKKEAEDYGLAVGKISTKSQSVRFRRL